MLRADAVEGDRVAVGGPHLARPGRELSAAPLEAVVRVPELARRQARPEGVVVAVRRRHHDGARPGELEDDPLQRRQPRRVEVLDDLDEGRRVEAGEAGVPVRQRPVQQLDTLAVRAVEA